MEKINELNVNFDFEIHLMVDNPLLEIDKWKEIKNLKRIIFHIESKDDPNKVIAKIRASCFQAGIAINPDTPIEKITPYADKVDEILFMTVYPGKQGAKFLPQIGEKIISLRGTSRREENTNHPLIAVDGGISKNTIKTACDWGVEVFCVGSALIKSKDLKQAFNELKTAAVDERD